MTPIATDLARRADSNFSRLGDSTVAAALATCAWPDIGAGQIRVHTWFGRALFAEHPESCAMIPSPDLTRNVIPLDVFPTSDRQLVVVCRKHGQPRLPANFGGGAVDIRTKGIPDGHDLPISSSGSVSQLGESEFRIMSYNGGSDDEALGVDDGTRALSSEQSGMAFNAVPGTILSVNTIFLTYLQGQDSDRVALRCTGH